MKRRGKLRVSLVCLFLLLGVAFYPAATIAADRPIGGLSYNPSETASFADLEKGVDETHLGKDLSQLVGITGEIRTYTVEYGFDRIPAVAAPLGLKVTLGVWLGRDSTVNDAAIAKAVAVVRANPQAIKRVIVGNETLQRGDMKADGVVAAMAVMRRGINGLNIPVGTAENWYIWLDNPELVAGSDFIAAHINPYWDGVAVADATFDVVARYDALAQKFPGKPIVIAETGWPSSGPARQGAVPSLENQARYVKAFTAMARIRGYTYFLIEAYDQPWKLKEKIDPCLWGIFDTHRAPKAAALQLSGH